MTLIEATAALLALKVAGFDPERLLVLRHRYRRVPACADGLQEDKRALFVKWLIAHGRLSEGGNTDAT